MSNDVSPWRQHAQVLEAEWIEKLAEGVADTYVYRYYDADDRLLYVDQTIEPEKRHAGHKTRSKWFKDVARRDVQGPFPKGLALGLEFFAINCDEPLHNRHTQNGYRGPGSRLWEIEMGEEFYRHMLEDSEVWRRERAWMAERMGSFFDSLKSLKEAVA